ncbi:MAG: NUDIX domain-containing protein, partial [Gammaproteobacteria bacterium]
LILIDSRQRVVLEKRPPSGIWGGLWSLPELPETTDAKKYVENQFGLRTMEIRDLPALRHGFTHFDLQISPRMCSVEPGDDRIMDAEQYLWYNISDPQSVGLPAAISRLLASLSL